MSVREQIISVIAKTLDLEPSELSDDVSLYSGAGVDSTEMVEVTVAISKALGVKLVQGDISNKITLRELVAVIEKKKQQ
jgi:acyl carrier protein